MVSRERSVVNPFSTGISSSDALFALQEAHLDYLFMHQPTTEVSKRTEAPACPECGSTMVFERKLARGGKYRCKNPSCSGDFR